MKLDKWKNCKGRRVESSCSIVVDLKCHLKVYYTYSTKSHIRVEHLNFHLTTIETLRFSSFHKKVLVVKMYRNNNQLLLSHWLQASINFDSNIYLVLILSDV